MIPTRHISQRHYDVLSDILFFRWLVTLFMWGLPALIGPIELLKYFNVPMLDDMRMMRLAGAAFTVLSIAYWIIWKDLTNRLSLILFAIIENGLLSLTFWILILAAGLTGWYIWASALLTSFFFTFLIRLYPRVEKTSGSIVKDTLDH